MKNALPVLLLPGITRRAGAVATLVPLKRLSLFCLCALATGGTLHAQGIIANAQLSGVPSGGGAYSYNLTLNNSGGSLSAIQTFWYSWVPGADFLPSSPISIQAPAGWTGVVQGGPYYDPYGYYYPDGYSIEFYTSTSPINPGHSMNFGFTSMDNPTALAGNSPVFPSYPVGTSYVFSGTGQYGNSLQLTVQSVPEPAAPQLFALALLVWLAAGWRPRRDRFFTLPQLTIARPMPTPASKGPRTPARDAATRY